MKTAVIPCFFAAILAGHALAQAPSVAAVENNYSYTLPGLPNYGIAQGSIFVLFGTGVGPAVTPALPDLSKGPLVRTLSGVTINVSVNGTTVQAIPYYVSAGQIAAILPASTPVGTGTITVIYNGQSSAATPIQVVAAAFGIDTLNGAGTGTAVAQDANNNYSILLPGNAARSGEILVLWGSGLGAANGDETKYPFPQTDLAGSSAVKVYIGGKLAPVAYAGRSQFPGVDQINVTVPAGLSGCNVSVVVQTGSVVSNTATIPIATTGRTCSDQATTGLLPAELQTLLSKPSVRAGVIFLDETKTKTAGISIGGITLPPSTSTTDLASASFYQYTSSQLTTSTSSALFQQTSLGSCTTYQFKGEPGTLPTPAAPVAQDAGTVTMKLPDASTKVLSKDLSGFYSYVGNDQPSTASPLFIPAAGGPFSFSNTGGADVGPISGANITMPPAVNWTNMDAISTIVRTDGVTVNWDTGTAFSGFMTIAGNSFQLTSTDGSQAIITGFTCTAPYSAGTFTVPSYVLLSLAPGVSMVDGISIPSGTLSLSITAAPVRFTAPNLDYAVLDASSTAATTVTYQ